MPVSSTLRRRARHALGCVLLVLTLTAGGAARGTGASWPAQPYRLTPWPRSGGAPDFELQQAHDGQRVTLASYRGRIVLLLFGFARCPDVCPMELNTLAHALRASNGARSGVQVLFVTLDPEHDRPALLARYVQAFGPQFIGLTGTPVQVDRAAAAFHVQHARVPVGEDFTLEHSTAIFVIDARGRVRLVGNAQSASEDFAHDLRRLVQG